MPNDPEDPMRVLLHKIKSNVKLSKVVVSRSYKTRTGDHFVAYTAHWNEDGHPILDGEGQVADHQLMTFYEGRAAHYFLAMQAEISCIEAAHASGAISAEYKEDAVASVKRNFAHLLHQMAKHIPTKTGGGTNG